MARWYTDFDGDTVGQAPEGWVDYDPEGHSSTLVIDEVGGRKRAVHTRGATNTRINGWIWEDVGQHADVEVFLLYTVLSGAASSFARPGAAFLRLVGQGNDARAFAPCLYVDGNGNNERQWLLALPSSDGWTASSGRDDLPWDVDDVVAMRARIQNGTVQVRWWLPADPDDPTDDEPETWDRETTSGHVTSAGHVGVGCVVSGTAAHMAVLAVGVGTGEDDAPAGPVDPPDPEEPEPGPEPAPAGCWFVKRPEGLVPVQVMRGGTPLAVCAPPPSGHPGEDLPPPDAPPPGSLGNVLLVGPEGELNPANAAVKQLLEDEGWQVTVRALDDPEAYTGFDVVVLSVQNPEVDRERFWHPPIGLVMLHSSRIVGAQTVNGFVGDTTDVQIVDAAHPIVDGLTGVVTVYDAPAWLTWHADPEPPAGMQTIVSMPSNPDQQVLFAFEAGTQMSRRWATTRHVGVDLHWDGIEAGLTAAGETLLAGAVQWAADSTFVAPPVPDVPTGFTVQAGNGQVVVSWDLTIGADNYRVTRRVGNDGPWLQIAETSDLQVVDQDVQNGQAYWYAVRAGNTSGMSGWSAALHATPAEPASTGGTFAMLLSGSELDECKQRAASGPFRASGDFRTGSPGHWQQMDALRSMSFSEHRWDGPQHVDSQGRVLELHGLLARFGSAGQTMNDPPNGRNPDMRPTRRHINQIKDCSYACAIAEDPGPLSGVMAELVWYATRPRLDFTNRTRWPHARHHRDRNPLFITSSWVRDMVMAYDICRAMDVGTTSQRQTVEKWFADLAHYNRWVLHDDCSGGGWHNRRRTDLTEAQRWPQPGGWRQDLRQYTRTANGAWVQWRRAAMIFNNRRCHQAGYMGLVGVLLGDQALVADFKVFVHEWLMFGHQAAGYRGDWNRGSSGDPQLQLSYAFRGLDGLLPAMDALARTGDTSLYDLVSSHGISSQHGTAVRKSMQDVLQTYVNYITGARAEFWSSVSERNRIKTRTAVGNELVHDAALLLAANYYGRQDWYQAVMRIGTPSGFGSPRVVGGAPGWASDWRHRFLRSMTADNYPGGG